RFRPPLLARPRSDPTECELQAPLRLTIDQVRFICDIPGSLAPRTALFAENAGALWIRATTKVLGHRVQRIRRSHRACERFCARLRTDGAARAVNRAPNAPGERGDRSVDDDARALSAGCLVRSRAEPGAARCHRASVAHFTLMICETLERYCVFSHFV